MIECIHPNRSFLYFCLFELLFCLDPITGLSSGAGFITFVDAENGKTALRELDRFDLGGKRIRVSVVDDRKPPEPEPSNQLEDNLDGSVGRIALMNKLAARSDPIVPKVNAKNWDWTWNPVNLISH